MSDKTVTVRAIRAAIALPLVILTIIPAIILRSTDSFQPGWGLPGWQAYVPGLIGVLLLGVGITLLVSTVRIFANVGEGTLAPWDPPKKLVLVGPYRHVRNPMHSGVFIAMYGESLLLGSMPILIFVSAVFVFHWFYIPLMEERWLARKFGQDYLIYKQNVPRWIPRLTPWRGSKESSSDEHTSR
jgi:protein-S-isoprenylcysteine O-methyltransferase Ste14